MTRYDRLADGTVLPPYEGPPPDGVVSDPIALAEWHRIAPALRQSGRLTVADTILGEMYTVTWAQALRLEREIETAKDPKVRRLLEEILVDHRGMCAEMARSFTVDADVRGRIVLPLHLVGAK